MKNEKLFTGLIPPMVTPLNAKRELVKAAVRRLVKESIML